MTVALILSAVLLLGNAFCVGTEFALIATRRTQIEPLAEHSRRARLSLQAMSQMPMMIAGAQLGINICSIGLGALAEPAIAALLEKPLSPLGMPATALHTISFLVALAIVAYLHTVIGEMVPKNIALAGPDRLVLWLAPVMVGFTKITKPVIILLKWMATGLLRLMGVQPSEEIKTVYTADELASLADESATHGLLDKAEHQRIHTALSFSERSAADVMKSWPQVLSVPVRITPAQLEALAVHTRRSRYPVVNEATRQIVGLVHVKEFLDLDMGARERPLAPEMVRPLAVVSPDTPLPDLLVRMRRERAHLVLVAAGPAPDGIVTLEDVLAVVVG